MIILWIVLAALAALLAALAIALVRTLCLKTKKPDYRLSDDQQRIVEYAGKLSKMVQVETISVRSHCDVEKFRRFHQVLRELALLSGVHIFSQTGDQFFAGGKFVGLYAESAGEKRIQFSFPVKAVYDAITGEKMDLNELFTDFTMEEHETRIFRFLS